MLEDLDGRVFASITYISDSVGSMKIVEDLDKEVKALQKALKLTSSDMPAPARLGGNVFYQESFGTSHGGGRIVRLSCYLLFEPCGLPLSKDPGHVSIIPAFRKPWVRKFCRSKPMRGLFKHQNREPYLPSNGSFQLTHL